MKDLDKFKAAVSGVLGTDLPTQEGIRKCIDLLRRSFPRVTDEEANDLSLWFEEVHGVKMRDGAALQDTGFEPWLEDARAGLDPYYWDRYRRLLVSKDFSGHVLATLDDVTDRILGFLENPTRPGEWDRRGMVVGHVQSGKTANYTGLVCKAADAGYKVIVIIAGIHNNLRNQTQRRIDEGFVGIDSTSKLLRKTIPNQIGVGCFDSRRPPATFTTSQRDFNKTIADSVGVPLQSLVRPAVFVIKKNTSTLRNLIEWLTAHNAQRGTSTIREPMLLIDDEADNASINIRHRQDEVSRINSQIRQLLQLFDRSCYVGYTATPFANIFIDPDSADEMLGHDLFPRDFIVSLDPPDNYFGATRVFSDEAERIVHHVDDHADVLPLKHPIDHRVTGLPGTLEAAVRVFVVARAIRLARRHVGRHNSMLVNVSRFVAVQSQIRNEIHALVGRIRSSARVNGARPPAQAMADPEIAALHQAFEEHYANSSGVAWADVQSLLHESASAVNVVEVNKPSGWLPRLRGTRDVGAERDRRGGILAFPWPDAGGARRQLLPAQLDDVRHAPADGALVRVSPRIRGSVPGLDARGGAGLVHAHRRVHRGASRRAGSHAERERHAEGLRPSGAQPSGHARRHRPQQDGHWQEPARADRLGESLRGDGGPAARPAESASEPAGRNHSCHATCDGADSRRSREKRLAVVASYAVCRCSSLTRFSWPSAITRVPRSPRPGRSASTSGNARPTSFASGTFSSPALPRNRRRPSPWRIPVSAFRSSASVAPRATEATRRR